MAESWWLSSHWSGNRVVNGLSHTQLWPLLGLTGGRIGPDPINRLVLSYPSTCTFFLPNLQFNLHLRNNSQPFYFIGARRWRLQLCWRSIVLRIEFWPLFNFQALKPEISRESEFRSWYEYTGNVYPSQPGRMGFPTWLIPNTSRTPRWVLEHWTNEKHTLIMASFFKKPKRYFSDSDTESDFPRFIIIESLQDTKLDQLSPFLIGKIISSRSNPKTVKKIRTGNLLVEVESKKHAENLLKMEKFHNL